MAENRTDTVSQRLPDGISCAKAIGIVTFTEIVRDKLLYNVGFCALALIGCTLLASKLAVLTGDRVLLDFGVAAMSVSCTLIAIFTGASMLGREFDRRTALVALSRPITPLYFMAGKFAGIAAVIGVNWLLFVTVYLLILGIGAYAPLTGLVSGALIWALVLALFQAWVVAALSVFFSAFTTTSLSAILALGMLLIGQNVSQIRWFASRLEETTLGHLLEVAVLVLPNFERFGLGTQVTYGLPVPFATGMLTVVYAILWSALLVFGASLSLRVSERA